MVLTALKKVFRNINYMMLAVIAAVIVFVLFVWLQNIRLVLMVVTSHSATLSDKFNILVGLLGSIKTNFSVFSASYTIVIAVLFAINFAMVIYYMKQQRKFLEQNGITASFVGFVSGMFGVGCAACGTLVLGPLLSMVGAGGIIALLPFGGQEFGILGVVILILSVFLSAKKIQEPLICEPDQPE